MRMRLHRRRRHMRALSVLPPDARRTALAAGLEPLIADVLLAWERAGDRERWMLRFTVASLVAGAAAVLVAGIWDLAGTESDGPVIAGLMGAGVTTALGVAALKPPGRRIVFMHEQNLLTPIERGRDPDHLYSTFVFRLLTLPTPTGASTPRERLIEGWRRQIEQTVPGNRRATAAALLWGAGGVYDDDVLALRRRLYEELEATLDSFARGVDLLNVTLARVLGQGPVGIAATGPS